MTSDLFYKEDQQNKTQVMELQENYTSIYLHKTMTTNRVTKMTPKQTDQIKLKRKINQNKKRMTTRTRQEQLKFERKLKHTLPTENN